MLNNTYLKFWPALEIDITKNWDTLTDNTRMPMKLKFKNHAQTSFNLNNFDISFQFEKNNGVFVDTAMKSSTLIT